MIGDLTYTIRNEVESVREDAIYDLRASRCIVAVLELLLEEDAGLLIVAVENETDDGLTRKEQERRVSLVCTERKLAVRQSADTG